MHYDQQKKKWCRHTLCHQKQIYYQHSRMLMLSHSSRWREILQTLVITEVSSFLCKWQAVEDVNRRPCKGCAMWVQKKLFHISTHSHLLISQRPLIHLLVVQFGNAWTGRDVPEICPVIMAIHDDPPGRLCGNIVSQSYLRCSSGLAVKKLTLFSQCKLAITGRNKLMGL